MTYAGDRVIYDADSHVQECLEFVDGHADAEFLALLTRWQTQGPLSPVVTKAVADADVRRRDASAAEEAEAKLMTSKLWTALGAFDPLERQRALDLLGFRAQLVFGTLSLFVAMADYDALGPDNIYSRSRSLNAAMAAFCADDRLIAVANVPLYDPVRALAEAEQSVADGAGAVLITTVPPAQGPSLSHADLGPFWSFLEEAQIPFMLHVGGNLNPTGGWNPVPPGFVENGLPKPTPRPGGEGTSSPLGYVALGNGPSLALATLIFDGVLERHPELRGGCIEQGGIWVPSFLKLVDSAQRTFAKVYEPLAKLSMKPSEYIHRQIKFTAFAGEPVGWMIETAGDDLFMFASDYPHNEGTTDPIGLYEATMTDTSEEAKAKFYADNFCDLMRIRQPATVG